MFRGDRHPVVNNWPRGDKHLVDSIALNRRVNQFFNKLLTKVLNVNWCQEFSNTSTYTATAPTLRAFFLAVSKSSSCPTSATTINISPNNDHTITNNVPSLLNQPSKNTRSIKPIKSDQFPHQDIPSRISQTNFWFPRHLVYDSIDLLDDSELVGKMNLFENL